MYEYSFHFLKFFFFSREHKMETTLCCITAFDILSQPRLWNEQYEIYSSVPDYLDVRLHPASRTVYMDWVLKCQKEVQSSSTSLFLAQRLQKQSPPNHIILTSVVVIGLFSLTLVI